MRWGTFGSSQGGFQEIGLYTGTFMVRISSGCGVFTSANPVFSCARRYLRFVGTGAALPSSVSTLQYRAQRAVFQKTSRLFSVPCCEAPGPTTARRSGKDLFGCPSTDDRRLCDAGDILHRQDRAQFQIFSLECFGSPRLAINHTDGTNRFDSRGAEFC